MFISEVCCVEFLFFGCCWSASMDILLTEDGHSWLRYDVKAMLSKTLLNSHNY
jgi:hypothetical protein